MRRSGKHQPVICSVKLPNGVEVMFTSDASDDDRINVINKIKI